MSCIQPGRLQTAKVGACFASRWDRVRWLDLTRDEDIQLWGCSMSLLEHGPVDIVLPRGYVDACIDGTPYDTCTDDDEVRIEGSGRQRRRLGFRKEAFGFHRNSSLEEQAWRLELRSG